MWMGAVCGLREKGVDLFHPQPCSLLSVTWVDPA